MNNPQDLLPHIRETIDTIAKRVVKRERIKTPYEFVIKDFANTPDVNNDIIINPGNPPIIILNLSWVWWCLAYDKEIIFRHKIQSALEVMHYAHRTLSHPIRLDHALALKTDAKRWVKTLAPELTKQISAQNLEFEYSVTVKDKITGASLTLHGTDVNEVRERAINRISRMVFETEELEVMHDKMEDMIRAKNTPIPVNKIVITGDTQQIQTRMEY